MDSKPTKTADVRMVCSTCGKPIAGKAQSNVTRYLSAESRCMCGENAWSSANQKLVVHHEEAVSAEETAEIEKNLGERYQVLSLLGRGGMGAVR